MKSQKSIIVAYKMDKEQSVKLVLATIKAANRKEKITAEVQLHSDQGFQYTSHAYFHNHTDYHASMLGVVIRMTTL